ncbi:MAG: hypothetical protein HY689_08370 [Chloroflexi bacterium]|nr:hypothetical protein [Chloroflexota bacterium]
MRRAHLVALGWLALAGIMVVGALALRGGAAPLPTPGTTESGAEPGAITTLEADAVPSVVGEDGGGTVLTQAQINAQIASILREQGSAVPVREVHVALLDGDRIRATGRAALPGQGEVPLTVDLALTSREGQLRIDITEVRSGGLPLPASLVEGIVRSALRDTPYRDLAHIELPQGVERVRVEQGRLLIQQKQAGG